MQAGWKINEEGPSFINLLELTGSKKADLVASFDWNAVQQVHFLNDKIRIGVLTITDLELALAFAKFIKAYSIHPYYHLLTTEIVANMQSKNFKIYPWTINEPEDIIFVKSLNVDGIITDFPDRV